MTFSHCDRAGVESVPHTISVVVRMIAFWNVLILFGMSSTNAAAFASFDDSEKQRADDRPNVIVVLADDLGYGDLGCYGSEESLTPHLDRFAEDGVRYLHCYSAAPNCSPSRAGLMTGRTPYRVGIYNWIPFLSPVHLRDSEVTIASLLRESGYDTCHVGKWHLNGRFNLPGQPQPGDHGFDHWFSTQNNALPNHRDPYNFVRNGIPVGPMEGYSADLVAEEAISWLASREDTRRPFFLFVCFHEPHEPIASHPRHLARYEYAENDPARAAFHANVTQLDEAFGELMAYLDEQELSDNTLVWFTSDNGPAVTSIHPHGSAGPLRVNKGHLYEGGIRVPGILRWPGHHESGWENHTPISGVDLLPTLCEVAGIAKPADRELDGTSFLPTLNGLDLQRDVPLYWQFNWARSEPRVAMRLDNWKLLAGLDAIPSRTNDITDEDQALRREAQPVSFELYRLDLDPAESDNLAEREADQLLLMRSMLDAKYLQLIDEGPVWPAWTFPRYEGERIEWPTYRGKRNRDDPQSTAKPWRAP